MLTYRREPLSILSLSINLLPSNTECSTATGLEVSYFEALGMSSSEGKRPQRRPSTLDLAAQDLMMAAQGSPSRPGSIVEQSQRVTNKDQTGTSKNRELPTQYNNSRSDDSKYPQDRDILGRRLSAVRLGLPEEFYRTKSPTPAKPPSRRQTPAAMSRSQTPVGQTAQSSASVRRWLDESSAEQKPLSEEIG